MCVWLVGCYEVVTDLFLLLRLCEAGCSSWAAPMKQFAVQRFFLVAV